MANVKVDKVVKNFGDTSVLKGIDIDIRDGEFITLVGPSGCGKSTLLRIIAGLENMTSGSISIGARLVNDVPSKSRDIAMVFQNYALYPHMTVADNMGFAMQISKVPAGEIKRRTQDVAVILGLEKLLGRYPRELSGGQRQRVAMGRAIVRNPLVFLFDEPLSNLDAKLRVQMRTEIKELHQRLKSTMIYVTHDQVEAMTLADRIVVMNNGSIEQIGAPLELYDRPMNRFVAEFIGSPAMNMIEGKIEDGKFMSPDGLVVPMETAAGRNLDRAIFGIRPEHVSLATEGLNGTVNVVEPVGSETHVVIKLGAQKILCAFRDRGTFQPGESIRLRFDSAFAHIFDEPSGKRINIGS